MSIVQPRALTFCSRGAACNHLLPALQKHVVIFTVALGAIRTREFIILPRPAATAARLRRSRSSSTSSLLAQARHILSTAVASLFLQSCLHPCGHTGIAAADASSVFATSTIDLQLTRSWLGVDSSSFAPV